MYFRRLGWHCEYHTSFPHVRVDKVIEDLMQPAIRFVESQDSFWAVGDLKIILVRTFSGHRCQDRAVISFTLGLEVRLW